MTVNLYMTWETPYLPAVAGLTVEAWPASLFTHSPVGNPSAYPPAPSPTATTTTDSSGNCELTGLDGTTDYYISIIDQNNQPWFQFCPAAYLDNSSGSPRRWSINQGPVPVAAGSQTLTQIGGRVFRGTSQTGLSSPTTVNFNHLDWAQGVDGSTNLPPGMTITTAGFYVVTAAIVLIPVGTPAAGKCSITLVGSSVDTSCSAQSYTPGGAGVGVLLNVTDIQLYAVGDTPGCTVSTPDDKYHIFGDSITFAPSSMALGYIGGTLS